jgi:hypothetical protein
LGLFYYVYICRTEPILEEELNSILKGIKNLKTPGEDRLNGDLFKYAGKLFNNRFLQLLDNIWNNSIPPKKLAKSSCGTTP